MKKGTLLAVASVALALCMLAGYTGIDAQTAAAPDKTIVQTAQENADLSTLVTALQTAGLVDTLNGQGPFTVFAPTNEAFAKLDPALLQQLLTTDVSTLREILLYHVVAGQIISTQLENGQEVKTVQGAELKVTVNASGTFINDAMAGMSQGASTTAAPAALKASTLLLAVPRPRYTRAPACPIFRSGGAVWPAMYATTGLLMLPRTNSAASSSALPPISPISTTSEVWPSFSNILRASTKEVPITESPPMPRQVDCPSPAWESELTTS